MRPIAQHPFVVRDAPARRALQRATDAAHRRLHAEPRHAAVMAGTIGLDGLVELYGRMLGFHRPLERRLRRAAPVLATLGLDVAARERAPLLVRDLAALGVDDARIARLPDCDALPAIDDAAEAIGCLYVLDGSRLGGTLLARALDPVCAGGAAQARRFFLAQDAGPLWRATCAAIERCGRSPEGLSRMTRAACGTFDALERWLARP